MLTINLFKNGGAGFVNLLRESEVEFTARPPTLHAIQASGEVVEILVATSAVVTPLAGVMVTWLNARASRQIMIQTPQGVMHTKGLSVEETRKALENASTLTIIQSTKD